MQGAYNPDTKCISITQTSVQPSMHLARSQAWLFLCSTAMVRGRWMVVHILFTLQTHDKPNHKPMTL